MACLVLDGPQVLLDVVEASWMGMWRVRRLRSPFAEKIVTGLAAAAKEKELDREVAKG